MPTLTDSRLDLIRALGVLAEPPAPQHREIAALLGVDAIAGSEWTEAFMVHLVPYASVYLNADGMLGGEAADRVAGFWRALRVPVPADADHLTALLGLYAMLVGAAASEQDDARQALYRQARTALLHEHLLCWLPAYTTAMADVAPAPYGQWAALLRRVLVDEVNDVGVPETLPAHLRAISDVPVPDGLDPLLEHLCSPARSGIVLTRGHIAGLARDAGLGFRLGERRRMLRSLIDQDPAGVLAALGSFADRWAGRHRADQALAGPAATFHAQHAAATSALLRSGL